MMALPAFLVELLLGTAPGMAARAMVSSNLARRAARAANKYGAD
jgi:hypothetical protein